MEKKSFVKVLPLAALVCLIMSCGNSETEKAEPAATQQETIVNQPADSSTIQKPDDAVKDSTTREDEKEEENEKDD